MSYNDWREETRFLLTLHCMNEGVFAEDVAEETDYIRLYEQQCKPAHAAKHLYTGYMQTRANRRILAMFTLSLIVALFVCYWITKL